MAGLCGNATLFLVILMRQGVSLRLSQQQINIIISQVEGMIADYWAIYVFGSFANGTATENSDVDAAVLCLPPIQSSVLVDLVEHLSVELSRAIDVVDMGVASDVLNMEIITEVYK